MGVTWHARAQPRRTRKGLDSIRQGRELTWLVVWSSGRRIRTGSSGNSFCRRSSVTGVDLERLTRDVMKGMEKDLGTKLEWVAVAHHNTEHPHVHVALRGVRGDRQPLQLERHYIKEGIRAVAEDFCTRQLGYRTELDAAEAERREVQEKRFTSLDRIILKTRRRFRRLHLASRIVAAQPRSIERTGPRTEQACRRPIGGAATHGVGHCRRARRLASAA